jgi:nucleoside-diphosphate-sugar epimerase
LQSRARIHAVRRGPGEEASIRLLLFGSSKFTAATGWRPRVDLRTGFGRTLAYFRAHFEKYVEADSQSPA